MMRLNRRFAATPAGNPYARALRARARRLVRAWSFWACGLRAVAAATRRFDCIIAQRFANVAQ
eukprot:11171895-Lingulodinium_polyedra.AAC.1